nr:prolipoprotein diacylglyceryl transferase [Herbiconiux sp. SYSU D00978]
MRDLGLSWFPDFNIHAYALCILAGIIAAIIVTAARLRRRGVDSGVVFDVGIFAVILGILGGRLYHVFTHPGDYFFEGANLLEIFAIWNGGMAIFGALIGGAIGTWIGCRIAGVRFWTFADALAPGLLLAQAFGRLGNYFNHELFGIPTDLPWGLEIESTNPAFPIGLPSDTLFHPTFLYEILWNLLGFAVILLLDREFRFQWGRALGLYLIWYGIGRSWFEAIRIDPSELFLGIRVNIWAAWLAILLGVVIFVVQKRRHPGLEPSGYVPGREPEDEVSDKVDSDETYTDEDDDSLEPVPAGVSGATATSSSRATS